MKLAILKLFFLLSCVEAFGTTSRRSNYLGPSTAGGRTTYPARSSSQKYAASSSSYKPSASTYYPSGSTYPSSNEYGPQPDNQVNRWGSISRVHIPNPLGTNPYGMSSIAAYTPLLTPLPSENVYTDDTANGYRIRKSLLDMHNYVRKLEAPAATFMTKLIWDYHLEAYATQWAQYLCQNPSSKMFEHSPDTSNGLPAWPYRISTGENLYTSSAVRDRSEDFSDVVSKWYAEREFYDWSTGGAKPGASQPVGHWKQLVRPQASAVGCAVVSGCRQEGDWRTFVACHYDYGNIGKDPYTPNYDHSPTCSKCPVGFDCCEQGLCSGKFPSGSTGLSPFSPAQTSTDAWYGCTNYQRQDCANTGASSYAKTLPNDNSNVEFNQCHCGTAHSSEYFVDTVNRGYFWFRDRCYQATLGSGDDNSRGQNLYAMLELNDGSTLNMSKSDAAGYSTSPQKKRENWEAEAYLDLDVYGNENVRPRSQQHTEISPDEEVLSLFPTSDTASSTLPPLPDSVGQWQFSKQFLLKIPKFRRANPSKNSAEQFMRKVLTTPATVPPRSQERKPRSGSSQDSEPGSKGRSASSPEVKMPKLPQKTFEFQTEKFGREAVLSMLMKK